MKSELRARRSVGTMVAASLISAVCGVVQTFWVPRVLSVDAYGHWRTFLLYTGYAGLLHLGLVDGALLRWSKGRMQGATERGVLRRGLRFLAVEHLVLLVLAAGLVHLSSLHALGHIVIALAVYALFYNVLGLVQVYFQVHHRFAPVAFGMSAPGAIFVVLLGALAVIHATTVDSLLAAYLAAWGITMLFLLVASKPGSDAASPGETHEAAPASAWRLGLSDIGAGWPIVLANTGFGLMQSADRVTVNLTRSLHDFAIYSLSQSTIYVPIAILAAVSRVAFSYLARTAEDGRARIYCRSSKALTVLWMLLLPYYFAVEYVVQRFLPKYVPGLAAGRILLLSVLFLSLIQIVQVNTFSLEGRQREFFLGSIVAVAFAFATAWVGSVVVGTLAAVAWSQVLTAMLWWMGNEVYLRRRTGVVWLDLVRIVAGFGVSAVLLEVVEAMRQGLVVAAVLYGVGAFVACVITFTEEWWMLIGRVSWKFGGGE